eukprot:16862-Chlamydomonas_euryale.AAC.4
MLHPPNKCSTPPHPSHLQDRDVDVAQQDAPSKVEELAQDAKLHRRHRVVFARVRLGLVELSGRGGGRWEEKLLLPVAQCLGSCEKAFGVEVEKAFGVGVEKAFGAEVEKAFGAEVEKAFGVEVEKAFGAEVEKAFGLRLRRHLGLKLRKHLGLRLRRQLRLRLRLINIFPKIPCRKILPPPYFPAPA